MFPRFTAVLRPVNPIPVSDTALVIVFTRAHPEGMGILRIYGYAADRIGTLLIEQARPRSSRIDSLPHTPGGYRNIPGILVFRINGDIGYTS